MLKLISKIYRGYRYKKCRRDFIRLPAVDQKIIRFLMMDSESLKSRGAFGSSCEFKSQSGYCVSKERYCSPGEVLLCYYIPRLIGKLNKKVRTCARKRL